jgi:hypothetical protein
VLFAEGPLFSDELRQARQERFGQGRALDVGEQTNFLDHFMLQRRLADGRTVVEHFVDAQPALPEEERTLLLGWRDVVEGIFAVERRDGDALGLVNLVNDLPYRAYSNMGPQVFARMPAGSFIIGRLVPIGEAWLLSGAQQLLPSARRAEAYRAALTLAQQHPTLVFRNPAKREQGWELQREERESFITFFGADLVVLAGHELAARMRAYMDYRMYEERGADGQSAAERAQREYGVVPPMPELPLPGDLQATETVGVLYDEVDGLNFLANFALVEEAFARPELAAESRHREAVAGYLEAPSISPRLLRRLADRDPERASAVFQQVLEEPGFAWERDGEALLQRYKASYFAHPVFPSVTPVSGALARAQLTIDAGSEARPARARVGRNDPCPCGSGKKYKRCCGR